MRDRPPRYNAMVSGGTFSDVMKQLGYSEEYPPHWMEDAHTAIRKMPDGSLKYWCCPHSLEMTAIQPEHPDIMWFDDPEEMDAWMLAVWRMR